MSLSLTEKSWFFPGCDEDVVRKLSEALCLDDVLAAILCLRGVHTQEEAEIFLESSLSQLRNPTGIPGIVEAADRIIKAIDNDERICIYGDYDVDGVTATSLMVLVLRRLGADVFPFIPHRIKHGYGLHGDAVHQIRDSGAFLLVTVDNGIAACSEVALALSLDMDVIITDHHEPPEDLPKTPYIVNPRVHFGSASDVEPFMMLAGVGLAFALMIVVRSRLRERADRREVDLPNLREYLDLVALGTIGDVVPISGENRILVRHGLQEMRRTHNKGLRELIRVSGLSDRDVTPGHVGFMLAPRINAAGRLGDAELALRLLVSSDEKEVKEAASILNQENMKRQEVEKEILEQALEQIELHGRDDKVIVLHSKDWHPGVIGIVASRIVDRFYRPTILVTGKDGKAAGSGRSIPGFSLFEALDACQEDLLKYGGHKMAAGLTLSWERMESFKEKINRYAESTLEPEDLIPSIQVDGILDIDRISDRLLQGIEMFKPFGMGNPEPKFLSQGVMFLDPSIVGENHIRLKIRSQHGFLTAIGFNMKDLFDGLDPKTPMDLLYHLRYNDYNGVRSIQLVLVDVKPSSMSSFISRSYYTE